MKLWDLRCIAIGMVMLCATGLALALKPSRHIADGERIDLERMIPSEFAGWRVDGSVRPIAVAPDVQAKLDKIYSQVLSRTYINADGERVMLSIAYGGDQSDGLRAHRPEVCYSAQGFDVGSMARGALHVLSREIPVMRLVARQGARIEPITYWMIVGDRVVRNGLEQKLAQIRFGLTGQIPDGLLLRVSSISRDHQQAYVLQQRFIDDMVANVEASQRVRVIGAERGANT